MTKISNCKELNYFDHMNILTTINNKHIVNLLQTINNKTAKLINKSNNNLFVIIHKCTKENNISKIQCSYFDKSGAYSDIVRDNYKEIFEYINPFNYRIDEVI